MMMIRVKSAQASRPARLKAFAPAMGPPRGLDGERRNDL